MKADTPTGETVAIDLVDVHTIFTPPKVAGGYRLGKNEISYVQISLTNKPNWFHRQMMKLCLGWYWYDAK